MPITQSNAPSNGMLKFFGLYELPFGVSPDPRFLYPSPQHREALASLSFGIENQVGIAALIGEPGLGKTTLLFDLLQRYNNRASTAFVFNTQCSGPELLRQIIVELQVPDTEKETNPIRLHELFTAFVASRMRDKPVVIMIDEAQNLDSTALETLRLLSNFEAADHKLLHIILSGQPQLAEKLRHPRLTQLLQRITMVNRLTRLSRQQIEECITFRLQVAGYDGKDLFTAEALDRITSASAGIPREFNRICISAMQRGYSNRQRLIDIDVIDDVVADLTLSEHILEREPVLGAVTQQEAPSIPAPFRVGTSISSHPEEARRSISPPEAEQPPASTPGEPADEAPKMDIAPIELEGEPPPYRPRPVKSPPLSEPAATGLSAAAATGPLPENAVQSHEDALSRRQQDAYQERQRALLRAAAQRRQAAEAKLRGMRDRMENGSAASHASYAYQFAMGSVPDENGEASQGGVERNAANSGSAQSTGQNGVSRTGRGADDGAGDKKTGTG